MARMTESQKTELSFILRDKLAINSWMDALQCLAKAYKMHYSLSDPEAAYKMIRRDANQLMKGNIE